MKYSEFKRKVEELGFGLVSVQLVTYVANKNTYLAQVNEEFEFAMDSEYNNLHKISPKSKQELFDILVEYAKTPIPERKDQKKYQIHPIWTKDSVLVRWSNEFRKGGYENERSFGIVDYECHTGIETTVFSENEAKEICDFFGWDFDKVAVEVDDDE